MALLRGLSKGDGRGLDLDKLPWSADRAQPSALKARARCTHEYTGDAITLSEARSLQFLIPYDYGNGISEQAILCELSLRRPALTQRDAFVMTHPMLHDLNASISSGAGARQ